jgi:hypothetical protein
MKRDRQLDNPERTTEVTAGRGDCRNDRLADLGGELFELRLGQAAKVGRTVKRREDRHAGWLLGDWSALQETGRLARCERDARLVHPILTPILNHASWRHDD